MESPPPRNFFVPALAIIGVGMIGGSLALGMKKRGLAGTVLGAGRSRVSLQCALELGVIDEICGTPFEAAARADVIVLAAPVGASGALLAAIAPALTAEKIVTDVGSVKAGVCEAAAALGPLARRFVPGHPVAGKEHSGAAAANADLFAHHSVVLTPAAHTDADALERIAHMWRALGAHVSRMEAAEHDRVLALTSHLPHVLAYAMVDCFAQSGERERAGMTAGGFYDFTRTASSDAEMWRDICVMNRAEILRQIEAFQTRLAGLTQMIARADREAIASLFAAAAEVRAQLDARRARR
ncbi:MAG: prephenate dehydrogenase/arogenate dehydrogenase family protein [Gammaproteobacteria bacterium]